MQIEAELTAVSLRVRDLGAVAGFYGALLGLGRRDGPSGGASFGAGTHGESIVHLEPAPEATPRPRQTAGLFHLAIRVPDRLALSHVLRRLRDHGYPIQGAADHLVSEALYTADPEGNGVEIYRDRPPSQWQTTEDGSVVMDTLPLDLEELGELTAGEPVAEMPDGTDLGHVHLEVADLEASRQFYREVLGMRQRASWRGAQFLAWGDYHHHVGLNTWGRRSQPAGDAAAGIASCHFRVESPEALTALTRRAEAHGLAAAAADGDGQVTLRDPNGVRWTASTSDQR
jgi:catechol 2,3-dioxygenase